MLWKAYNDPGPVEAGVQGVPRHTQYLAVYLVKTKSNQEKIGVRYLCAHPIFSGFHRPCRVRTDWWKFWNNYVESLYKILQSVTALLYFACITFLLDTSLMRKMDLILTSKVRPPHNILEIERTRFLLFSKIGPNTIVKLKLLVFKPKWYSKVPHNEHLLCAHKFENLFL